MRKEKLKESSRSDRNIRRDMEKHIDDLLNKPIQVLKIVGSLDYNRLEFEHLHVVRDQKKEKTYPGIGFHGEDVHLYMGYEDDTIYVNDYSFVCYLLMCLASKNGVTENQAIRYLHNLMVIRDKGISCDPRIDRVLDQYFKEPFLKEEFDKMEDVFYIPPRE